MRDFFKQCLEDLEALTGNRQMYFFATDPDGTRKLKVCLDGMVLAAKDYPYIPEESQQKIIREQMVKDQTYEALNSRTVHKWLTQAANAYRTHSHFSEDDLTRRDQDGKPTKPAPPEVAEKYAAQILANLSGIAKHVPQLTAEQIQAEGKERKDPYLRGAVASGHSSLSQDEVVKRLLHNAYLRANYHPITREKLEGWMPENQWIEQQSA